MSFTPIPPTAPTGLAPAPATAQPAARKFKPTAQQEDILTKFRTGAPLVVQAGAGTGKTSTLELLAEDMAKTGRQGVYITLNKAMATEVGSKFVHGNVRASTIHSLAWRIASKIPQLAPLLDKIRRDEPPVSRFHWHRVIGFNEVFTYTSFYAANLRNRGEYAADTTLSSQKIMWAAIDALRLWCQSDRRELSKEDVVRPLSMQPHTWDTEYAPLVIEVAQRAWIEDILKPEGKLPFTHDYYLKLVTLAQPKLTQWLDLDANSVLFFDEAQDSRPCVTYLLSLQDDMQIVAVGDSSQAIYGFTGARDGLPKIEKMAGATTASLTTSFRFGSEIAGVANTVLDTLNAPIRLTGNPDMDSEVHTLAPEKVPDLSQLDAILVHTNARLLFAAERCMQAGIPYTIMADTSGIYNLAYDYDRLANGEKATRTELRDFDSQAALFNHLDSEDSRSVRSANDPLIRWMREFSTDQAREILNNSFDSDKDKGTNQNPVVLSTAHKSKGRQWDCVWVDIDADQSLPFTSLSYNPEVKDGTVVDMESRQALMLAYVALTRAREDLYVSRAFMDAFDVISDQLARGGGAGMGSSPLLDALVAEQETKFADY